jgi:hypothetical protein
MNSTDAFMDGLSAGLDSEPSVMQKLAAYHEDQGALEPDQAASDLFVSSICDTLDKVAMEEDSSDKKDKEMPDFLKKKVDERKDGKSTKKENADSEKAEESDGELDKAASMKARFASGGALESVKAKLAS